MVALTIGMATYDDFDGVYFTLQALRLYQDVEDTEFLVVDNFGCDATKAFVESVANARYVRATEAVGTAAAKNVVFERASGRAVLCIDSHVLLDPGVVARLKAYYRAHPDTKDLLQGPLVYDDLHNISTHFAPEWRGQMWGIWATDERGLDPDREPFDIPMQGMGLFSCRRKAWPRFNPAFRGFGGEEGYIHEKVRQRGGRALCLPWLRWTHRFGRPKGVPYPLSVEDKLRNYVIGFTELGLDTAPALEHFAEFLSPQTIDAVLESALRDSSAPRPASTKGVRSKGKKRRKADALPEEAFDGAFDEDMARMLLDAIPDEVRVAFGAEPLAIADFPPPGPDREAAREASRSLLLEQGWLRPVELENLTIDEAVGLAQRRVRTGFAEAGLVAGEPLAPEPGADDSSHPRSPPGLDPAAGPAPRLAGGAPRAIVCFVDDNPHLLQQAVALCLSWRYASCPDTDFVAMGPEHVLRRLPDDVVKVAQRPATDDPVWRGYGYVNSIACMNGAGAEVLDRYSHVLRTDVDTFITPAWNAFRPDVFTVGFGGYCNDEDTRRRIRDLAAEYGLTHRGMTNAGSTWYGPTAVVRRASAFAEMLTKRLLNDEFAEDEGQWPGWFRGVSTLYAGEIAVNHCAPDAQRSELLDFHSTSGESIQQHPHIHCWHTDDKFSKYAFMDRRYADEDATDLDLDVVRDYCLALSLRSLEVLGVPA